MRLWIRPRRRKISERPFADSGRFPDAVPKSSGLWPRKKVHRNPAAGAGAARSVLLSRSVEDQNPFRFFCEGLALIISKIGLGRTFRAKTLGSAGCQPALVGSLPNTAGKMLALPRKDQPRKLSGLAPQPRWLCYRRRLLLFPLGAAEQWQDEQVRQDVNDTAGEHHQTEPLRRWKIGQHENSKTGGEDHVGINNAAPLFLASGHPGCPAFLSVTLRAANPENKMDHRVDRDPDADIGGWRGDHIHRHAQPANPAKHAERHKSQAHDQR